jgi:hypothetical protein
MLENEFVIIIEIITLQFAHLYPFLSRLRATMYTSFSQAVVSFFLIL